MDLSDDMYSGSVDPSSIGVSMESPGSDDGVLKSCTDCRTTKTPLWRGGPQGPKTLCNACGIRYRKKRREALGLPPEPRKEKTSGVSLKIQMLGLGQKHQVVLKQHKLHHHHNHNHSHHRHHNDHRGQHGYSSWLQKQRRGKRRINEVEQAAVLLMALSSGLFYA